MFFFKDNFNRTTLYAGTYRYSRTTLFLSVNFTRTSKNVLARLESAGNQRLYSGQVGTSETIRVAPFFEWLAGLIDGDGCFLINKKGYTSLEITMGFEDLRCLRYIQNELGMGSIKMRSGAKAYRYRIHNSSSMKFLLSSLNGYIRHSIRLNQYHRLCKHYGLEIQTSQKLTNESGWFAGFFDADGTVGFYSKGDYGYPQLTLSVSNKHCVDIQPFKDHFGGNIFFDKSQNGCYKWSISKRSDIISFISYSKLIPFRSFKSQRFFMIPEYYRLYDLKAYRSDNLYHKHWTLFCSKWERGMI